MLLVGIFAGENNNGGDRESGIRKKKRMEGEVIERDRNERKELELWVQAWP